MSYETSVGKDQRIYNITLSTDLVHIWDLMDETQKSEINNFDILDGYVYAEGVAFWIAHKIGGAEEPFSPTRYAYFPFVDWHKKIYIRAAGPMVARVKMIVGFIQHHPSPD
jgi:hypothetical protein